MGGQLEDYAGYALALLELYDATYRPAYLQEAVVWAEQMQALLKTRSTAGITRRPGMPSR